MLKVFLSQPMANVSQSGIERQRSLIFDDLPSILGEEVREVPSYIPKLREQMQPLYCLGASIQLMSEADVVVFAEGWEEARGCRIEHECALQYGKRIVDLSNGQLEASA